ncbi:MAG: GspE/PulE family protein [Gammaproteobacteria bacterium]|nr:GspE/PulE family protein [Gammaproteobacteria bacterium]
MSANMKRERIRLGDLLIEHKLISQSQLQAALDEQKKSGRRLGRVLIANGYVDEDAMLQVLSKQMRIPYVDLSMFELNPKLVQLLPETDARRHRALVLKENPDSLLVAMGDPMDIFAYDSLVKILQRPVELAIASEEAMLAAMDRIYHDGEEIRSLASEVGRDLSEDTFDLDKLMATSSQSDAPVVRLIQTMFEGAAKVNASDIHIEPGDEVLRIRRRIDGILHEQIVEDRQITGALVSRLKLMAHADISEKRLPQDGRFSVNLSDRQIDVRLSTIPTQSGEGVVMRLLDQNNSIKALDQLGMPQDQLDSFRRIIHKPHGLVLVTGPTGSGKTTTLYSALNELNTPQRKIITIEDPVEYRLTRISQVQVNSRVGLDFSRVLRTALRLDPDILLLGEIRDQETGEIALRASLTGHLVLSTLHTNDAVSSATRLMDMGLEGYLVASAVQCILAQRLIRRVCQNCATPRKLDASEQAWLHDEAGTSLDNHDFLHGSGCNQCNQTGYSGRIGIYELLVMDSTLTEALRNEDQNAFQTAASEQSGYRPLVQNALDYARDGITTIEEVIRLCGWAD